MHGTGAAGNNGGKCYSDCEVMLLHLESGSGCTKTTFGGTTGGAIKINCYRSLIIEDGACITSKHLPN